jgi:hypothetical protein
MMWVRRAVSPNAARGGLPILGILLLTSLILLPGTAGSAPANQDPIAFFRSILNQRESRHARPEKPPAPAAETGDASPEGGRAEADMPPLPRDRPVHFASAAAGPTLSNIKQRLRPAPESENGGQAEPQDKAPAALAPSDAASPPDPQTPLTDLVPLPREKPAEPAQHVAMLPEEPATPPPAPRPAPSIPSMAGDACRALAGLGIEAKPLAAISEHDGACGIASPISLDGLDDGSVKMPVSAVVNCSVAATVATWMDDTVQPAARAAYGMRVTAIRVAGAYECRGRNRLATAKLSEHAFGNAIDIGAFEIGGGRWIEVKGEHGKTDSAFLAGIREAACGPFKTVLGPGSDPYHSDHFHLDLAQRRTAGPSGGLYCK